MTHENADTMINCEILSTETAKNTKSMSTFVSVTNWTAGDRTSNKKIAFIHHIVSKYGKYPKITQKVCEGGMFHVESDM